jgi:Tol biopolymer transport system component
MALASGTRLGPYEILGAIGAGGMGEVYRGRDTRLARDVAVKVMLSGFATDPDRLRRFEAEARAVSRLNHPNILAIYDIGTHDGSPYIVSELLEGQTLRERLTGGPLAIAKVIDFAVQIAHGLGEAHNKGVTHRDLKPENLFITRNERVKILDFGLAKLSDADAGVLSVTMAPTGAINTEPGLLMGSVGYMSPEQVRGQPADRRSDMFSFGAVLYEMISGTRPFQGDSAVETLNAVLKDEPAELSRTGRPVDAGLERVVRRCLEKNAEARWQTASDLAFALEAFSISSPTPTAAASHEPPATHARPPGRRIVIGVAAGILVLAAVAAAYRAGRNPGQPVLLSFHRLTFGRGTVWSARFAPEGGTIAYSAAWDGKAVELFSTRPDSPESRVLGVPDADVLAVSAAGEMALLVKPGSVLEWGWKLGTLARASLAGGAPRETQRGVQLADWAPDGASLAVVRAAATRSRLEFPAGKLLYETPHVIGALRVSRAGDLVAFAERPSGLGGSWSIGVVDLNGKKTAVSTGWAGDFIDLAWSPAGSEIWFDTRQGGDDSLHAVTLAGRHRLLARLAVPVQLFDVSRDGRLLIGRAYWRGGIIGVPPGGTKEQDFSWLDASEVDDISYDGKQLLITEFGDGGGVGRGSVYVRGVDRSPAVRLGDGQGFALSPDGSRALSLRHTSPPELVLLPIGAGEPIVLKNENISDYTWADWVPDGKRIVFNGSEAGHGPRCFVQGIDGGGPRPITPEGTTLLLGQRVVSPDGEWAAVIGQDGKASLYPLAGGNPRPIPGLEPGDVPIRWSVDERALFVFRKTGMTPGVYLVDFATGRGERRFEIVPPDPAGIINIWGVHVGPDERSYYYSYMRNLSDLYLVEGLK